MRLYPGGPFVKVRWFRAPKGADMVPQPNPYVSSTWDDAKALILPTVGEPVGQGFTWNVGDNPLGYKGNHPCGAADAWNNGGAGAPLMRTNALGTLPCCDLQKFIGHGGQGQGGAARIPSYTMVSTGGQGEGGTSNSLPIWTSVGGQGQGGHAIFPRFILAYGGDGQAGQAKFESDMLTVGEIKTFAFDATPAGWLECDGSSKSQSTYAALYAALGTTWGPASGGTFTLPDFRRKVAMGRGGSGTGTIGSAIGDVGGEEAHLLTDTESGIAAHSHQYGVANTAPPGGEGLQAYTSGVPVWSLSTLASTTDAGPSNAADGHNTIQPSAVIKVMIYAGV